MEKTVSDKPSGVYTLQFTPLNPKPIFDGLNNTEVLPYTVVGDFSGQTTCTLRI